jgi:hypothetical protein
MGSVIRSSGAFNVKRIAIIGAGPSGLAVAKYLVAEDSFDKIDIYEQQYGILWPCCFVLHIRTSMFSLMGPSIISIVYLVPTSKANFKLGRR